MNIVLERLIKYFKKLNFFPTFDYDDNPAELLGGDWERVTEGYALWTTTTNGEAGKIIAAGLPNIKGQWWSYSWGTATEKHDAVTTVLSENRNCKFSTDNRAGIANDQKMFNANEYNAIYGNSNTVQPPAIKIYLWKKIA